MSLWQSAVRRTLAGREMADIDKDQIEHGVSVHAQSTQKGKPLDPAKLVPAGQDTATVGAANVANASKLAFDSIQAHQTGDSKGQESLFSSLHDLIVKYSTWDIAGWAQCGWYYVKYYVLAHLPPSYNDWQAHAPADPNFGVIDYRLPPTSRVLMVGDWGTHMADNAALLRAALDVFKPQAIIHLGDVYYSGTVEEVTENVLNVLDKVVADLKLSPRPAFFAIPGNHDYYAGGSGFYQMIGKVNSGVAGCTQQASFFCLRTADDKWQFLAMDTGYGDRNPVEQTAPTLHDHEFLWHQDKLDNFPGSTILLSHHQLCSAKEALNAGPRPYLNEALYALFKRYFDRIAAWYWGHEHNFIVFDNNLKFAKGDLPLRKGRLIGCSAYEETLEEDPYEIKYAAARFIKNMPKLGKSQYLSPPQNFYNHAFAIFDVTPTKVTASYYEYPSWGLDGGPTTDPPVGRLLLKEDLLPTR